MIGGLLIGNKKAMDPQCAGPRRRFTSMNVFVIGATGAIGGHAVPALVRAAHTVTALARTPEKAAQLSKQGASPITVSMFDRTALTEAFKGYDAVVNLATAIPPTVKFLQTEGMDRERLRPKAGLCCHHRRRNRGGRPSCGAGIREHDVSRPG